MIKNIILYIVLLLPVMLILEGCCCCVGGEEFGGTGMSNPKPSSFDTGKTYEEAMAGSKPVLVYFYSDSCGACVRRTPVLVEVKDEYADKVEFVMLNVYSEGNLADQYNVRAYPSYFLVNPSTGDLQEVPYDVAGSKETFIQYLDQHVADVTPQRKVFLY